MTTSRRPRWLWWLLSALSALTAAGLALLALLRGRIGQPHPEPTGGPVPTPSALPSVSVSGSPAAPTAPTSTASPEPGTGGLGCEPSCRGACGSSCDKACSSGCDEVVRSCGGPLTSCDGGTACHTTGCGHLQVCSGTGLGLLAWWCSAVPGTPLHRVTGPARLGITVIRGYQRWVSPRLGAHCRYVPSCSAYGIDALRAYGALTGSRLALARIRRCTVEVPCGTPDPA